MSEQPAVYEQLSARERLLAAANELFYGEGVNTVGIDRIIERAGVAKASLYNVFGSKDELIRAYLNARHEARKERVTLRLARIESPREKILATVVGPDAALIWFLRFDQIRLDGRLGDDLGQALGADVVDGFRRAFHLSGEIKAALVLH